MANAKFIRRVMFDLTILILIGIPTLIFTTIVNAYRRGFFCDDETIRYPVKDDTVPMAAVGVVGVLVPIATILILEIINSRHHNNQSPILGVRPLLFIIYYNVVMFCLGGLFTEFTTEMGKRAVGRLRPNFIDTCFGTDNVSKYCNAKDSATPLYIESFDCTGDPEKVEESRLSFPSGHASVSCYTMLYFALYIRTHFPKHCHSTTKYFLQFVALMAAYYTCLSRVVDNKHHPTDVLGGMSIGVISALIVTIISNMNSKLRLLSDDEDNAYGTSHMVTA